MNPHEHHDHAAARSPSRAAGSVDGHEISRDPVCGMDVLPAKAAASVEHGGKVFYFCCQSCAEKFRKDPGRFTTDSPDRVGVTPELISLAPKLLSKPAPVPIAPPSTGIKYTCPMDPEIIRDRPGACPICGMALEPVSVSAEEDSADPELMAMTRRFWICLALTSPLLLLSMAEMIPGLPLPSWLGGRSLVWIEFALAAPVVLWGGSPFFQRGWSSLVNRRLNMFTLIAMGTGVAFLFSVVAAIAPGSSRDRSEITTARLASTSSPPRSSRPSS